MHLKELLEEFKHLPPATQIALILCVLAFIVLLTFVPTMATSILTFLVALKALTAR